MDCDLQLVVGKSFVLASVSQMNNYSFGLSLTPSGKLTAHVARVHRIMAEEVIPIVRKCPRGDDRTNTCRQETLRN